MSECILEKKINMGINKIEEPFCPQFLLQRQHSKLGKSTQVSGPQLS